jgi:hypothetical protein
MMISKIVKRRRARMASLGFIGVVVLLLGGCSKSIGSPSEWTCESLIDPAMEVADGKLLKLSNPLQYSKYDQQITCLADAEWKEGSASRAKYGAHMDSDGDVFVEVGPM